MEIKICFQNKPNYLRRGFYNNNKKCITHGKSGNWSEVHKEKDINVIQKILIIIIWKI